MILGKTFAAHLAPDARCFETAERRREIDRKIVEADGSGTNPLDDIIAARRVGAEHGAAETVGTVVGDRQRLIVAAIIGDDLNGLAPLDRERWAVVLLSMMFRDPWSVERIHQSARDHYTAGFPEFSARYEALRAPHEPETFDEFIAAFDRPGLSEFGAQILRSFATNRAVRRQLLAMNWQVVTIGDAPVPLLTSDRPVIRFKGLKEANGLLMLPLGPSSFFVAYNNGPLNMRGEIQDSIIHGRFLQAMNEYIVQSAVRHAYGSDDSQRSVVERHLRREGDPVLPGW